MDPIGSSTSGITPLAAQPPAPRNPEPARARTTPPAPAPRPAAEDTPALPVALQRENLRPPAPAMLTRETMMALLMAAVNAPAVPDDEGSAQSF